MSAPPLIGINGLALTKPKPGLRLDDHYPKAILSAGGTPVAICPLGSAEVLDQLVRQLDGVLLTGGDDFDMEHLGLGATHPMASPTRTGKQDFDFRLLRAAENAQVPTLGICYGMQLMGVAHGAPLFQHLPDDRPGCQEHSGGVEHEVLPESGSKLALTLGLERFRVISRHHQALGSAPHGWSVAARDSQGLIEAIEKPGTDFMLGVQWHPELSDPSGPNGEVFKSFIQSAAEHAASKSDSQDSTRIHS